jgi:hypothetical protein
VGASWVRAGSFHLSGVLWFTCNGESMPQVHTHCLPTAGNGDPSSCRFRDVGGLCVSVLSDCVSVLCSVCDRDLGDSCSNCNCTLLIGFLRSQDATATAIEAPSLWWGG